MTFIAIYPLRGIDISGVGSINLGQPKSAIEKILGQPGDPSDGKRWFYHAYERRIDFDEFDTIEFIEYARAWLEEELEKSRNFATIGIGRADYYKQD